MFEADSFQRKFGFGCEIKWLISPSELTRQLYDTVIRFDFSQTPARKPRNSAELE